MEVVDTVANFFRDDRERRTGYQFKDNNDTTNRYNKKDNTKSSLASAMDSLKSYTSRTTEGMATKTETLHASGIQGLLLDRLVEKVINIAIPSPADDAEGKIGSRVEAGKNRPGLSVPIMSRNFVQMNARLSFPFKMLNEVIRVLNWENPAYTLSIAALLSFVVLKPVPMLSSGPLLYILFVVMVPSYLNTHRPEPWDELGTSNPIPATGPPLKEVEIPKPVPEFSKEFLLNLTDLQNHMVLYVIAYDFIDAFLVKFAFFKDENISAATFMTLFLVSVFNLLYMDTLYKWIPFKLFILAFGWSFIILLHPNFRDSFLGYFYSEETRIRLLTFSNNLEKLVNEYWDHYEPRENRQAAIFEIQKFNKQAKAWETVCYSPDDFTLLAKSRIAQQSLESTALSLSDVKAPQEWEWISKYDWVLDLDPRKWVNEGIVQHVDVDTETKWVYDLSYDGNRGQYRRRRWIRLCTRIRQLDTMKDSNDYDIYDELGMKEMERYTGVSLTSMHGLSRRNSITNTNSPHLMEKRESEISGSNLQPDGHVSNVDTQIPKAMEAVDPGSKAVKSLTHVLNSHS
ncbi:HHL240Cp [Eremothecium sinecaudum]|uniref:HHL240Cp n=1 Tax=Eremothecium sinecaudum TaxID=45286 RepID=A0A120K2T3_9SACH|nr:HHL240Cp [Eremothecium sinecaudum]AMD22530.1 HHL240Cp [Eremothecium sinecaudum]